MLLSASFLAIVLAAIPVVPDEPGAIVLPDASILQTVAADLDLDGRREIVRLVRGENEAVLAQVWMLDVDAWRLVGDPVEVVPPARIGTRIDPVYQSTPVRMLVRRVGGLERVTVVSQPHFEEIDVGPPCCLLLHDLLIEGGAVVRRAVAGPSDFSTSILVIDLDGDGTDELLSTLSRPPSGDISYPIDARVHRWADGSFAAPTVTRLPVGSGDSPFRLGDSDGRSGDEAAIISTLGPPGLFRIRLAEGDRLEMDAAGVSAEDAVGVPIDGGRGVALAGPVVGLMVAAWAPGQPISPLAESVVGGDRIVGTVSVDGQARLVVHEPATGAIDLLGLPDLLPPQGVTITRSPAAAAFTDLPLAPYSGPLPGGLVDGRAAIIHAGRLIPSLDDAGSSGTDLIATLAGAEPVGLVGGGELIALHHGPVGRPAPGPRGGPMVVPPLQDGGWTSIAPLELTREAETEGGDLDPPLRDAIRLDARDGVAVGRAGFIAEVRAPPGSRVIVTDFDPSVIRRPIVVPESGRVDAPFVPPAVATANPRYRATLLVVTPAGHAHRASWSVRVRTDPPPVEVTASTPFGSADVEVEGRTVPYATVRVGGEAVEVRADGTFTARIALPPWPTDVSVAVSDGLGNVARRAVSGVGVFDYRGLPWAPITATLVAVAAVVLFLRVPRTSPFSRGADDDAALEELDAD